MRESPIRTDEKRVSVWNNVLQYRRKNRLRAAASCTDHGHPPFLHVRKRTLRGYRADRPVSRKRLYVSDSDLLEKSDRDRAECSSVRLRGHTRCGTTSLPKKQCRRLKIHFRAATLTNKQRSASNFEQKEHLGLLGCFFGNVALTVDQNGHPTLPNKQREFVPTPYDLNISERSESI